MASDYYGTLGVRPDATSEEIKRAYRKLARELHPDVNPDVEAQQRFREVTAAYEVLSDPQKRKIVDMGGDPLGNGAGGMRDPFAGFGFGDIMDAFFGAAAGGARGARSRVQPGSDALIRIELTLEECNTGVSRELTVDTAVVCDSCQGSGCADDSIPQTCDTCAGRGEVQTVQRSFLGQVVTARTCPVCRGLGEVIPDPCRQCGGEGRVRARRTITAKIPPGVADGMRVRLAGQGEVGPGGGPAGDLYVEVVEAQHPTFERNGADLHCTLRIPMTTAALGAVIPLETLEGTVEMELEPGTQPATELLLTGHGLPKLRSSGRIDGRGDLHVHIEVEVPTKLDTRQTELLRELASLRGDDDPGLATVNGRAGGLFSRLRSPGPLTTTPVFLVEALPTGDHAVLDGPEGRHAATVRRLRAGEELILCDGRGALAHCVIESAERRDALDLRLLRRWVEPPPQPRLVLAQALVKGDRGELAVELATEAGADVIVPWRAQRSVARWDDGPRGAKALARWRDTAREAAKQSRRAWVPEVAEPVTSAGLAELIRTSAAALLLESSATTRLADAELPTRGDLVVIVGPEGGTSETEATLFRTAGAQVVRLGPTVLRASTAGVVSVSAIGVLTQRWR